MTPERVKLHSRLNEHYTTHHHHHHHYHLRLPSMHHIFLTGLIETSFAEPEGVVRADVN